MPLGKIISWLIKKRIHQIELFIKYPLEVQQECLKKLLNAAKDTEWGKKYAYSNIKNYEEYVNNVPLQNYEDIKKYVIQLKQGKSNLLWPGNIKWFAKSSGTTNDKSKFIPVSKEALEYCHYKCAKDMLAIYLENYPESNIFSGKGLMIGGSRQINQFNPDSYYGDLSAIIIKNLPFWAVLKSTPDRSIALMDDWEKKIDKMAKLTMKENVTQIVGVPSWTLVLLKRILKLTGENNINNIWPNLELFVHGGVSFIPYKKQFESIICSDKMHYLETYNASEGFFGIQDNLNKNEMLLMLDYGIFYEFIPEEEFRKENPKTVWLADVETDKNYELVISTNAGLWRYRLGDTIKFTSLKPYHFIYTGRTKHFINAFGEELIMDNADKAIYNACKLTNSIVSEYTAAPVYMDKNQNGAHEWIIEFEKKPDDIKKFIEELDKSLKKLNSDYEAKRSYDLVLRKPIVKIVPKGTFYKWMKLKGKLGGQNKIPRLYNSRKYIDEINEIIKLHNT